jgi:C4-dicarboxylate transporter DctM subunit
MAFMIFIGTWAETFSQIIVLTPIFLPVVTRLGVDPIHFGVLFVVTAEIGFLTPPFGANLFVGMKIAGTSLEEISKAVLPYILTYIVVLAILVFFPEISLFLPRLVFGK